MSYRRGWVALMLFCMTLINYIDRATLSFAIFPIQEAFHLSPVAKGYLFIVLDIARFVPLDIFKGYMDTLINDVRSGERAEGVDRIYVPGEIEHLRMDERLRDGIPLDSAVIDELEKLGAEVGLGSLVDR